MGYKLTWEDNNATEEGHRVYRSDAPMDPDNLPEPLAVLGPDVIEYVDYTAAEDEVYFYRVSAFLGGAEVVSDEIRATKEGTIDDPTDIAGCQLWLEAADFVGVLAEGDRVALWADKSGNGHDFDQPDTLRMPTFTETAPISGKPMLQFAGTSLQYLNGLHPGLMYNNLKEQTVVIATLQSQNPYGGTMYAWREDTSIGFQCLFQPPSKPSLFSQGASVMPELERPETVQVLTYVMPPLSQGAPTKIRAEGVLLGEGAISDSGSFPPETKPVRIGARGDAASGSGVGYPLTGYIGEIIVYDRVLSDEEIRQVEKYVLDKWYVDWLSKTAPEALPGLFAHYVADDLAAVYPLGSEIELWGDSSGGGRDASWSSGGKAVLEQDPASGRHYISFSEAGGRYEPSGEPLNGDYTQPATLFIVHTGVLDPSTDTARLLAQGRASFGYRAAGTQISLVSSPAPNAQPFSAYGIPIDEPQVHSVTYRALRANPEYRRQGVAQRPLDHTARWAVSLPHIGATPFWGDIYEIAIFDRELTDEEVLGVSYYLRDKYNLY